MALRSGSNQVSLCEVLDRVLNKGVVVAGDILITVADVELVYLGLQVVLTSVETMNRCRAGTAAGSVSAVAPTPATHQAGREGER